MSDKKYSWGKGGWKFLVGAALAWVVANFDNLVIALPDNIEKIVSMSIGGLILMGLNYIKFKWFSETA